MVPINHIKFLVPILIKNNEFKSATLSFSLTFHPYPAAVKLYKAFGQWQAQACAFMRSAISTRSFSLARTRSDERASTFSSKD